MMNRILDKSPALRSARANYLNLSRRDQLAVQLLAIAVAGFLVYALIWRPIADYADTAEAAALQEKAALVWMKENEAKARSIASTLGGGDTSAGLPQGQSLISVIGNSARNFDLELQRFEPRGEDQVNVWLDKIEFNQMMLWLETLREQSGIVVSQINVDRTDVSGQISARISLTL
ncbi:type II secretion system protein M [Allohahella marinimesophila]|uniref:Type II secretion system protein M n=1 Tax=Allohahella marinimesophila TaxID=1054972 RepID=A0ABP7QAC5_9GAMM